VIAVGTKIAVIAEETAGIVAVDNDIQDFANLIDTVSSAVAKFETYATELDIDKKLIESIKGDFVEG
jgi:hypothetical protein